MHVAVLGAGYVGLTTAVCLAHMGRTVTVYDASPDRAGALRIGIVPFHEERIADLLAESGSGRFRATDSPADALNGADLMLVRVVTPRHCDGKADLAQVKSACTCRPTLLPRPSAAIPAHDHSSPKDPPDRREWSTGNSSQW